MVKSKLLCMANLYDLTLTFSISISSIRLLPQALCFCHIELEFSEPPNLFTYISVPGIFNSCCHHTHTCAYLGILIS